MKELLSLLPRPSHYIGTEEGSVHKEPASVRLHCALAFPDLYEVGMSYLGHKILYTILNNREDIFAERVYAPCRETGRLLREHGVSLATLESDTDIVKTHMFAFAITHELCFTNVLYMLELSGFDDNLDSETPVDERGLYYSTFYSIRSWEATDDYLSLIHI